MQKLVFQLLLFIVLLVYVFITTGAATITRTSDASTMNTYGCPSCSQQKLLRNQFPINVNSNGALGATPDNTNNSLLRRRHIRKKHSIKCKRHARSIENNNQHRAKNRRSVLICHFKICSMSPKGTRP